MNVCMSWHFFDVFCSHQLLIVKKVCNNLQRYSLKQEVMNKLKKVLFFILNKLWWGQQVWHLFILCVCVCARASVILRQWQFSLLVTWQDLFWGLSPLVNSSGGKRGRQSRSTHSKGLGIKLKLNFYNLEIIGKSYFLQKKRSFALKPWSFGRT